MNRQDIPLSPDDLSDDLVRYLYERSLVPIVVHATWVDSRCECYVWPPFDMRLVGVTSRMDPGLYEFSLMVHREMVLHRQDPAAFNHRHLVPMPLGKAVRQGDSVGILMDIRYLANESVPPGFKVILWGQRTDLATDALPGTSLDPRLLKALRVIKASEIEVDDPEVRALLDTHAKWL